ncbi:hypothetical protein ACIF6L_31440 [Kitasatospora sp. NPDC086009]|uniref:hypothetical protein n=1 Tax=unclassified Kitasatospora TaxID=2633591 RepID=UPI0037CC5F10
MKLPSQSRSLHASQPSVYLDLWVWIRLAKAATGRAREAIDNQVLFAVREASRAGVLFPLSSTHYMEMARITDPRQRADVAQVMVSISRCRTLRSSRDLLRHQFLCAMHETFGRPAFRPAPPEPLGVGVSWAFSGQRMSMQVHDRSGRRVDSSEIPGRPDLIRKINQFTEFMVLAGPKDEDIEELRQHGYQPEKIEEATQSRIAWEEILNGLLADDPISRSELRVRIQAREVYHEHRALLSELLDEYRIDMLRMFGFDPERPKSARPAMIAFTDRIPSVRLAVDLKLELVRAARVWSVNSLHDIDALSMAVPYCHVVMPDGEMADLMARSKADQRNGTMVLRRLAQLPDVLTELTKTVRHDIPDWDLARPGEPFCTDMADLIPMERNQAATLPTEP